MICIWGSCGPNCVLLPGMSSSIRSMVISCLTKMAATARLQLWLDFRVFIRWSITSFYTNTLSNSRSRNCIHPFVYGQSRNTCNPLSGPSFIELLSKQMIAWSFFLDKNRIINQIFKWFSRAEYKSRLNTNHKQYPTNGNLVDNPVFIKEYIPFLANVCA